MHFISDKELFVEHLQNATPRTTKKPKRKKMQAQIQKPKLQILQQLGSM